MGLPVILGRSIDRFVSSGHQVSDGVVLGNGSMKISVCLAIYNGANYLVPQVQSILNQLGQSDEIVIVDDCSEDESVQIVNSFGDARIRLLRNALNLGVLATFERALRESVGDILFLCDQDDIWRSDKVERIVSVLASDPVTTMVVTDAQVIDAAGNVTAQSFFRQRGAFSSSVLHNLVKNKYLGCTMAFRRSMLGHFLPIPSDVPMHDMWFGLLNSIYGRTLFIDQTLIAYRRHGNNASPSAGASPVMRVVWRWRLIKNLFERVRRDG